MDILLWDHFLTDQQGHMDSRVRRPGSTFLRAPLLPPRSHGEAVRMPKTGIRALVSWTVKWDVIAHTS